jgi:hypothetical protein
MPRRMRHFLVLLLFAPLFIHPPFYLAEPVVFREHPHLHVEKHQPSARPRVFMAGLPPGPKSIDVEDSFGPMAEALEVLLLPAF